MVKIGWRIWLLVISLALALLAILNGNISQSLLASFLIILIPLSWGHIKTKTGKVLVTIALSITLIFVIYSSFQTGVLIKTVDKNSTSFNEGLRSGMIIKQVNGMEIKTPEEYTKAIDEIFSKKQNFTKVIIKTDKREFILFVDHPPKIAVEKIPKTKIKTGLALSGGARALVKAENISLSSKEIADLISVTNERFNVYGISDITIRPVKDLEGNYFMLVEIAGATPSDLKELVGKQGKFEAKIGNETVFVGGKKDISTVCRNDATCSRIESCFPISQGGYACKFSFSVYLSPEAAERHANITSKLHVNVTNSGRYLDKKLDLYLDNKLVDSLLISEGLKGRVATQISVSGSGTGKTKEEAFKAAKTSMHKLQTILITGSLPYKLKIVKLDTVSPLLGSEFTFYLLLAGLASIITVTLIVFIRYRRIKSSLAVLLTSFSEVIIILGIASVIRWNLDLASIAGILTVIGTGVDQQVIILDESRTGEQEGIFEKLKRALFIIVGAYFTSLASLIPLYWAGAGLLRGFAVTTIIGITTGVLITRPAFVELIRRIEK